MQETRTLKAHPALIFQVIEKQSGTLGKAILEGIFNSIDAGATYCKITLDSKKMIIEDDGKGFVSRDEIENFFETFGTPHTHGDARVALYRIGRGQIMSFASTVWRSGTFTMAVDIKQQGLDYHLKETPDDLHHGCRIEGDLYDPLSPGELISVEREVATLAKYSDIDVIVNGKKINKPPTTEKWDYECDEFYARVKDGGETAIYNVGALVRTYPNYMFGGIPAVIVSKVAMQLNTARNEVLQNQCPVFRKIKKWIEKQSPMSTENRNEKKRVTDDERHAIVTAFLSGTMTAKEFIENRVVPLAPSGYRSLNNLVFDRVSVMPGDADMLVAEQIARSKVAKIILPRFIEWCDLDPNNPDAFMELIKLIIERLRTESNVSDYLVNRFQKVDVVDYHALSAPFNGDDVLLAEKDHTDLEKSLLTAVHGYGVNYRITDLINDYTGRKPQARTLRIGLSARNHGWTDGSSYITINRRYIESNIESAGFGHAIAGLLVHEYLHNDNDCGSHVHDLEFYEVYHHIASDVRMGEIALEILIKTAASIRKKGKAVPRKLARHIDMLFDAGKQMNLEVAHA